MAKREKEKKIKPVTFSKNEYLAQVSDIRKMKDKYHALPVTIVDLDVQVGNRIYEFTTSTSWYVNSIGSLVKVAIKNKGVEIIEDVTSERLNPEIYREFTDNLDIKKLVKKNMES